MSAFTYPGVYIEEIPSGQHTITGVATSIAAFIGWSNQGPVGEAMMVESWSQYEALFGGLIPGIYLGYAVYQFFLNGGSQAYIIRLYDTGTSNSDTNRAITASATVSGMTIHAANPGQWANAICVAVTNVQPASGGFHTFNLQVLELSPGGGAGVVENYTNLSTDPASPNFAVTVINNDSANITFTPPGGTPPTSLTVSGSGTSPVWVAAGSWTTPAHAFTSGDAVTQSGSGATDTASGTVNGSYLVLSSAPTPVGGKAITSFGAWTAGSASFAPTTAPVQIPGPPLGFDGSATAGADGEQLKPDAAAFETQLLNTQAFNPFSPAPLVTGYALLSSVPIFNLLCVPGETDVAAVSAMQSFCAQSRAFLIVDSDVTATVTTGAHPLSTTGPADSAGDPLTNQFASNSAFYFPWVSVPDPAAGFRATLFPPCGFVAGIYASTDASRGVWKAPAGIDASLTGAMGLQYVLTDGQNGLLNPLGINCLRQFPNFGEVVWGARTIAGSDAAGSQWKYVPIRRLALYIESSLYQGTQWAVFEPNAEPLWGQVRLSIGTFMQGLFLKGAFAGTTPQQAYFVKCDADNNPPPSVALGILNVTVGFAPLYPAEFVVIQIQQMMSQS